MDGQNLQSYGISTHLNPTFEWLSDRNSISTRSIKKSAKVNFEAGAREAGKDPSRMPRMIELGVDYTDDEETAIEYRKNYWAGTFVPAPIHRADIHPKDVRRKRQGGGSGCD